jgi:hypothetical protein
VTRKNSWEARYISKGVIKGVIGAMSDISMSFAIRNPEEAILAYVTLENLQLQTKPLFADRCHWPKGIKVTF